MPFSPELLRKARKAKGLSQVRLAAQLDQKPSFQELSAYENGRVIPSLYRTQVLAHALGCRVDDLLSPIESNGHREVAK